MYSSSVDENILDDYYGNTKIYFLIVAIEYLDFFSLLLSWTKEFPATSYPFFHILAFFTFLASTHHLTIGAYSFYLTFIF